jgi:hypothetical protein
MAAVALVFVMTGLGCDKGAFETSGESSPASASLSRVNAADMKPVATIDHGRLHPGSDPQSPCVCAEAKQTDRWCWRCNVGYVAGQRIESSALFEGVDPHGHELDNECLQLQPCREAIRTDAYCEAVGIGFVAGKAYFTRLTYGLARGQSLDASAVECATCQSHIAHPGWCKACARGIIGYRSFTDPQLFEYTSREYCRLLEAIQRVSTCQTCALAMLAHAFCPVCRVSYESDSPVAMPRQRSARQTSNPQPPAGGRVASLD